MALTATARFRVRAQFLRAFTGQFGGMTKADVQAAVDAVDGWADANAVAFNQALPLPFRTTAGAELKAALLAYICMRRAGVLWAEED